MDRIPDSGSDDGGSIPPGCTLLHGFLFMRLLKLLFFIIAPISIMICCSDEKKAFSLQSGDLLFTVGTGNSELLTAIQNSTSAERQLPFSHVGIVEITNQDTVVIEATAPEGVISTPLKDFLNKTATLNNKKLLAVGRLKTKYQYVIPQSIDNAKQFLGRPYDYAYDEENYNVYCSELVRLSFKDSTGNYLFPPIAMTFINQKSGLIDSFWIENYKKMGLDVPEGKPGTNPSNMFSSDKIEIVHTYYLN